MDLKLTCTWKYQDGFLKLLNLLHKKSVTENHQYSPIKQMPQWSWITLRFWLWFWHGKGNKIIDIMDNNQFAWRNELGTLMLLQVQ